MALEPLYRDGLIRSEGDACSGRADSTTNLTAAAAALDLANIVERTSGLEAGLEGGSACLTGPTVHGDHVENG